jgi:hypothetical protein
MVPTFTPSMLTVEMPDELVVRASTPTPVPSNVNETELDV